MYSHLRLSRINFRKINVFISISFSWCTWQLAENSVLYEIILKTLETSTISIYSKGKGKDELARFQYHYMWCFARFGTICTIKKRENTQGGVLLLEKLQALKVTVVLGCFSCFLNYANDTKSRKASHIINF